MKFIVIIAAVFAVAHSATTGTHSAGTHSAGSHSAGTHSTGTHSTDTLSAGPQKVHKFTTKYDDIALEDILKSERLLKNYYDCLMETKPCTPDGTELKKAIPLALKENCGGCSEKQKAGAETVIHYLAQKKPDLWKNLENRYDPDGVYRTKHAEFAAHKGIKV